MNQEFIKKILDLVTTSHILFSHYFMKLWVPTLGSFSTLWFVERVLGYPILWTAFWFAFFFVIGKFLLFVFLSLIIFNFVNHVGRGQGITNSAIDFAKTSKLVKLSFALMCAWYLFPDEKKDVSKAESFSDPTVWYSALTWFLVVVQQEKVDVFLNMLRRKRALDKEINGIFGATYADFSDSLPYDNTSGPSKFNSAPSGLSIDLGDDGKEEKKEPSKEKPIVKLPIDLVTVSSSSTSSTWICCSNRQYKRFCADCGIERSFKEFCECGEERITGKLFCGDCGRKYPGSTTAIEDRLKRLSVVSVESKSQYISTISVFYHGTARFGMENLVKSVIDTPLRLPPQSLNAYVRDAKELGSMQFENFMNYDAGPAVRLGTMTQEILSLNLERCIFVCIPKGKFDPAGLHPPGSCGYLYEISWKVLWFVWLTKGRTCALHRTCDHTYGSIFCQFCTKPVADCSVCITKKSNLVWVDDTTFYKNMEVNPPLTVDQLRNADMFKKGFQQSTISDRATNLVTTVQTKAVTLADNAIDFVLKNKALTAGIAATVVGAGVGTYYYTNRPVPMSRFEMPKGGKSHRAKNRYRHINKDKSGTSASTKKSGIYKIKRYDKWINAIEEDGQLFWEENGQWVSMDVDDYWMMMEADGNMEFDDYGNLQPEGWEERAHDEHLQKYVDAVMDMNFGDEFEGSYTYYALLREMGYGDEEAKATSSSWKHSKSEASAPTKKARDRLTLLGSIVEAHTTAPTFSIEALTRVVIIYNGRDYKTMEFKGLGCYIGDVLVTAVHVTTHSKMAVTSGNGGGLVKIDLDVTPNKIFSGDIRAIKCTRCVGVKSFDVTKGYSGLDVYVVSPSAKDSKGYVQTSTVSCGKIVSKPLKRTLELLDGKTVDLTVVDHTASTIAGSSGGPLMCPVGGALRVCGIHVGGNSSAKLNHAVLFDDDLLTYCGVKPVILAGAGVSTCTVSGCDYKGPLKHGTVACVTTGCTRSVCHFVHKPAVEASPSPTTPTLTRCVKPGCTYLMKPGSTIPHGVFDCKTFLMKGACGLDDKCHFLHRPGVTLDSAHFSYPKGISMKTKASKVVTKSSATCAYFSHFIDMVPSPYDYSEFGFPDMSHKHAREVLSEYKIHTGKDFDMKLYNLCIQYVLRDIATQLNGYIPRPYTMEESMNMIDLSKSAGYPWSMNGCLTKYQYYTSPFFSDFFPRYYESMKGDAPIYTIIKLFLKEEMRPKVEDVVKKARMIFNLDPNEFLLCHMLCGDFNDALCRNAWRCLDGQPGCSSLVGMSMMSRGFHRLVVSTAGMHGVECDTRAFDRTVAPFELAACCFIRETICMYSQTEKQQIRNMYEYLQNKLCVLPDGAFQSVGSGVLSGFGNTTIDDVIVQALRTNYAIAKSTNVLLPYDQFNAMYHKKLFGDDKLLFWFKTHGFDPIKFSLSIFYAFGATETMSAVGPITTMRWFNMSFGLRTVYGVELWVPIPDGPRILASLAIGGDSHTLEATIERLVNIATTCVFDKPLFEFLRLFYLHLRSMYSHEAECKHLLHNSDHLELLYAGIDILTKDLEPIPVPDTGINSESKSYFQCALDPYGICIETPENIHNAEYIDLTRQLDPNFEDERKIRLLRDLSHIVREFRGNIDPYIDTIKSFASDPWRAVREPLTDALLWLSNQINYVPDFITTFNTTDSTGTGLTAFGHAFADFFGMPKKVYKKLVGKLHLKKKKKLLKRFKQSIAKKRNLKPKVVNVIRKIERKMEHAMKASNSKTKGLFGVYHPAKRFPKTGPRRQGRVANLSGSEDYYGELKFASGTPARGDIVFNQIIHPKLLVPGGWVSDQADKWDRWYAGGLLARIICTGNVNETGSIVWGFIMDPAEKALFPSYSADQKIQLLSRQSYHGRFKINEQESIDCNVDFGMCADPKGNFTDINGETDFRINLAQSMFAMVAETAISRQSIGTLEFIWKKFTMREPTLRPATTTPCPEVPSSAILAGPDDTSIFTLTFAKKKKSSLKGAKEGKIDTVDGKEEKKDPNSFLAEAKMDISDLTIIDTDGIVANLDVDTASSTATQGMSFMRFTLPVGYYSITFSGTIISSTATIQSCSFEPIIESSTPNAFTNFGGAYEPDLAYTTPWQVANTCALNYVDDTKYIFAAIAFNADSYGATDDFTVQFTDRILNIKEISEDEYTAMISACKESVRKKKRNFGNLSIVSETASSSSKRFQSCRDLQLEDDEDVFDKLVKQANRMVKEGGLKLDPFEIALGNAKALGIR